MSKKNLTRDDVQSCVEQLIAAGTKRPTRAQVHAALGTGSMTTVVKFMKEIEADTTLLSDEPDIDMPDDEYRERVIANISKQAISMAEVTWNEMAATLAVARNDLTAQREQIRREAAAEVDAALSRAAEAIDERDHAREQMIREREHNATLEANIKHQNDLMKRLGDERAALQDKQRATEQQLAASREEENALKQERASLTNALASVTKERDLRDEANQAIQQRCDDLQKDLEKERNRAEDAAKALIEAKADHKLKIESLTGTLKDLNDEHKAWRQQVEAQQKQAREDLQASQRDHADAQKEIARLNKDLAAAQKALEGAQSELAALKKTSETDKGPRTGTKKR